MPEKFTSSLKTVFASVQLALWLLFLLASTSIVGTVLPQNQPQSFYLQKFGEQNSQIMHLLGLTDMYSSWWFLTLLLLFAINLIVCSVHRLPGVLKIIQRDISSTPASRLEKMAEYHVLSGFSSSVQAEQEVEGIWAKLGWKMTKQKREEAGTVFYAGQQGAWTRLGVYIVHISILLILAGALLGSASLAKFLGQPNFAFKGYLFLPEGGQSDHIFSRDDRSPIPLGFSVACKSFTIDFYDNGMPKSYLSEVTVLENGQPVREASIAVNKPLKYKGMTFYQSSYEPMQGTYMVSIMQAEKKHEEQIQSMRQVTWQDMGVSFGILNEQVFNKAVRQVKLWFTATTGEAISSWVPVNQAVTLQSASGTYTVHIRQLYATGLQVNRDPGVPLVYLGCALMLLGLWIAFFRSHKQLYALIRPANNKDTKGVELVLAGSSNKNPSGFAVHFQHLLTTLDQTDKTRQDAHEDTV